MPADSEVLEVTKSKRAEPRIPFGWVVERGLLPPGTVLHGTRKHQNAKVRADGTLVSADATGSIHQVGAHVQGLDACNGWTFWQFELPTARWCRSTCCASSLRAELSELKSGPPSSSPCSTILRITVGSATSRSFSAAIQLPFDFGRFATSAT